MSDNLIDIYDVIVYCGAKCGGVTLAYTFEKNNYNTLHLHGSNCLGLYSSKYNIKNKNIYDIINNSKLYNSKINRHIYIIDSYRNPIERKISAFFQNISIDIPDYNSKSVEELIKIFNEKYLFNLEEYHSLNQILKYYNLPLFENFDFNNKYNQIKLDNIIFIKLRFTDIHLWNKILTNIFNKEIIMYPNNLTENKNIYKLYSEFKKVYKIPKSYIEKCLINNIENKNTYREFKIYNNEKEQNDYIKYWMDNSY